MSLAEVMRHPRIGERIPRSAYDIKMFTEEDFRRQRQQEVLHRALVSLYDDAVPPTHGSLKGRLGELEQELGLNDPDISKNFMAMYRQYPDVYIVNEANKGNEATVHLRQSPDGFRGFVNPLSEEDPYDESLWIGFEKYLNDLMKIETKPDEKPPYVFSRGRYGMACELRKRALRRELPDFFRRYSLGELSHIIQLGITQRNLLAYENNELKPVAACKSRTHALLGQPTESRADDMPHIQNIAELVMCLSKLMPNPKDRILLSMLKKRFKSVFGRRVDETALGCTKLSSVMELPAVQELFILEKASEDNSGLVLRRREHYDVHKVLAFLGDYIGGPHFDASSLPSLLESQQIKPQSREIVGPTNDVRKAQMDGAIGAWPQAPNCGTAGTWGQALPFGLASQQYVARGQPVW
jgi:hypothetical protein